MAFGKLSIVLSTHAAQFEAVAYKGDLDANLRKIAAWGYRGVELAIRDPDLVAAAELKNYLAGYGLVVPAIGTGQAWGEEGLSFTSPDRDIREAAVSRLKKHLIFARQFDALVIIGLIRGITPAGHSKDQSMRFLKECLQECMEVAVAHQVSMVLEPLNRYETDLLHTVDEALELIHLVGSANLGLLLDTFHMNIEEPSIEESILRADRHIFHFHVADSNRWPPGAGHLDFISILNTLKSTGYQGWVSGEFMPIPDADTAAKRGIEHLNHYLDQINP